LAFYKKHDPSTNEEAEYMENLFNCLCSSLLWGPNRDKFLKGEGPQLMNLMLKERKQSRSGALKVLNHAVSGPNGAANANKIIEILGLRTLFPLFMKTPKKAKRKGLTAMEHEEHVVSILASILQHVTGQFRSRVLVKYEENDFEKIERLCELHFKYSDKLREVNRSIKADQDGNESLDEDEIYMRKLDSGLFTLQLIDYIILEVCSASQKCKDKVMKLLLLRRENFSTIKDIVKEYAENIGDENPQWRLKQQQNIEMLLQCV
jgi:beta-catenin-like protein 1